MNAVLLQIDPAKAIEAADKLGSGSPQAILAYVAVTAVVGLGSAAWWGIRNWVAEIKSCSLERREELLKNSESNTNLAKAIEGTNQINRAMLDALRAAKP